MESKISENRWFRLPRSFWALLGLFGWFWAVSEGSLDVSEGFASFQGYLRKNDWVLEMVLKTISFWTVRIVPNQNPHRILSKNNQEQAWNNISGAIGHSNLIVRDWSYPFNEESCYSYTDLQIFTCCLVSIYYNWLQLIVFN